ncbi:uncharacterized protein RAG0_12031 [Rhynchosporium agropyri]|uniref:F-box domain-containing protein n=1 Tax=Rhynchosporium agropyri TaxID=914238 RepID=A0A1E1L6Q6_9HELO|nr:uncharacterized protein RAG0_12031 [Rhynchosporium agropyri]
MPPDSSSSSQHESLFCTTDVGISPADVHIIINAGKSPQELAALPGDLGHKALMYYFGILITSNTTLKNNFFRLLTNERCEIRHGIIEPAMVENFCPLDNGRHDGSEAQGGIEARSIGQLQILPLEIMQDILCRYLDLETVTKIRCVSRGLRNAVDSLLQYESIITHALNSIRAALTRGGFLYLPTCSRVCYQCFTHENKDLAYRQGHCQLVFDIIAADLESPDVVKALSLSGRYGTLKP